MRAIIAVFSLTLLASLYSLAPAAGQPAPPRGYSIPLLDLADQTRRQGALYNDGIG